jgi:hypothetical protein
LQNASCKFGLAESRSDAVLIMASYAGFDNSNFIEIFSIILKLANEGIS